ncbi:MAG: peroxide stress protein YaaA [Planctomycetota bacterium]
MLICLSPAKTLDFDPVERHLPATKPALHAEAKKLASVAKELSLEEVAELMELSDQLAATAYGYLQSWKAKWDAKGAKPAVLAFRGDVYQGLDADTLTDKQLEASQDQVRILSGLYGVLRPLDLMQPYRLEMGRKLANPRGKHLYDWWGDRVTEQLNADLAAATPRGGEPLVMNLASNEYWSVVRPKSLAARVVTPVFKDKKGSGYRVISFFAKRARGAMARHLLKTRQRGDAAIRAFGADGYQWNESLSSADKPVFTREASD